MQLLDDYFKLQQQIYDYFGYREDWVVLPIDDQTDKWWMLIENADGGGKYVYSDVPIDKSTIESGARIYSGSIYTQRFLPKWVYRAKDYTMVCANTQTDGNRFLMIFKNENEFTDQSLKDFYMEHWG